MSREMNGLQEQYYFELIQQLLHIPAA
jgi:hypothetical protein